MKVVAFTPGVFKVPSQGAPAPGQAPRVAWPAAVLAIVLLTAGAEAILYALRRR
jgi:hypothetical protein